MKKLIKSKRYPKIDLVGKRFGRLVVIKWEGRSKYGRNYWLCECDCGELIVTGNDYLINKSTKSCGCLRKEKTTTHNLSYTNEYQIWLKIKDRCFNKTTKAYKWYGGRGITIWDKWKKDFKRFYKDIGKRPSLKYTLDRIDNDGNYEPSNCKWSTQREQNRNYSRNINITYNNKTQCIMEWSEELNIKYGTLRARLINYGWSIEKAFNTPVRICK